MPLILPPKRAIRPNPLAYPAGVAPGIDWSHPAASGCLALIYPKANNAINQAGQDGFQVGFNGSGLTATIDAALGPSVSSNGTGAGVNIIQRSLGATPTGGSYTFAAFARPSANAGPVVLLASNLSTSSGVFYQAILGSSNWGLRQSGVVNHDSGIPALVGVPYFYAASVSWDGSNWTHNHVVVRLDTGKVTTASGTVVSGSVSTLTETMLGYMGASTSSFTGSAGPAMFGLGFLSIAQLQQWGTDPWSLWYPNKRTNLVNSAGAAATFLAAWARGSNLPVIGTGNF